MKIPLFGGQAEDIELDVSRQLTQNWYVSKSKNSKGTITLYPTPGLSLFKTIGTGPIRGDIEYNGKYFCVSFNEFYEVESNGDKTLRGTLSSSSGRVVMAHNGPNNGQEIIIADGLKGYIYNSNYETFFIIEQKSSGTVNADVENKLTDTGTPATFITDGVKAGMVVYNTTDSTVGYVGAVDSETVLSIVNASGTATDLFPDGNETYLVGEANYPSTATHVEFMDGRFIANDPTKTGQFAISASYHGSYWDSTEVATAERDPDALKAIIVSNRQLWLIGHHTAEQWYNSGAADFPFEPVQSGFSQWGTAAPYSPIEVNGMVFWVSENDEGCGPIVATTGGYPTVISTPEITAEIAKMTTISDCYTFAYQKYGHTFVVFQFPTEQKTLVYDIMEQEWHRWKTESTGYHRSATHTFVFNKHLVGDPINGNIYELKWDTYTDNSEQITRIRRSPNIHAEDKALRHDGVWIDIKEAVADATTTNPQINLRWRDDNGSYSNYHQRSMGQAGEHTTKCVWRGLGRSHDRVYEISVTDPVNAVLVDAFAKVRADAREIG